MSIYLTGAIPNKFLVYFAKTEIIRLSEVEAYEYLTQPDYYEDYDDLTPPSKLNINVKSFLGHESSVNYISKRFTDLNNAYLGFKKIVFELYVNREEIVLCPGDEVVACLILTPRRIREESVKWTSEELEAMPVEWVLLREAK